MLTGTTAKLLRPLIATVVALQPATAPQTALGAPAHQPRSLCVLQPDAATGQLFCTDTIVRADRQPAPWRSTIYQGPGTTTQTVWRGAAAAGAPFWDRLTALPPQRGWSSSTPVQDAITGDDTPDQHPPKARGLVSSINQAALYWVYQGSNPTCSEGAMLEAIRQLGGSVSSTSLVRLVNGDPADVAAAGITPDTRYEEKLFGDYTLGAFQILQEKQGIVSIFDPQWFFSKSKAKAPGGPVPPDGQLTYFAALAGGTTPNMLRALTAEGYRYRVLPAKAALLVATIKKDHDPILATGTTVKYFGGPADTTQGGYHTVTLAGIDSRNGWVIMNNTETGTNEISGNLFAAYLRGGGRAIEVLPPKAA